LLKNVKTSLLKFLVILLNLAIIVK